MADKDIAYWKKLGVSQSMSDKRKPTQNSYIEAFFSILKRFRLTQREFLTIAGCRVREIFKKIFSAVQP